MSTFGQNVVKARVEKRWKQKDLQAATKLSQRYLSAVEHDKVDPRLSIVRRIAQALEVSFDTLIHKEAGNPRHPEAPTAPQGHCAGGLGGAPWPMMRLRIVRR